MDNYIFTRLGFDVGRILLLLQLRHDSSESLDGSSSGKRLNRMKSYDAVVFDVLKVSPDDFAVSVRLSAVAELASFVCARLLVLIRICALASVTDCSIVLSLHNKAFISAAF